MRKRSIALVVAFVMSAVAMAFGAQQQGKMGQAGKPTVDEQVARMKTHLNLTDQQAAQVKELFEKQSQEIQTWRSNNPNPTKEQMQTHRRQLWQERDEGLKKILTPEQYQKHQEMMKEQMKKHGMKQGPKGPPQN
jgi:Spy/CpxP family protein refolding chaperone